MRLGNEGADISSIDRHKQGLGEYEHMGEGATFRSICNRLWGRPIAQRGWVCCVVLDEVDCGLGGWK